MATPWNNGVNGSTKLLEQQDGTQARPCTTSTMPYNLTQMEENYQKIVSLEVSTKEI